MSYIFANLSVSTCFNISTYLNIFVLFRLDNHNIIFICEIFVIFLYILDSKTSVFFVNCMFI